MPCPFTEPPRSLSARRFTIPAVKLKAALMLEQDHLEEC